MAVWIVYATATLTLARDGFRLPFGVHAAIATALTTGMIGSLTAALLEWHAGRLLRNIPDSWLGNGGDRQPTIPVQPSRRPGPDGQEGGEGDEGGQLVPMTGSRAWELGREYGRREAFRR